MKALVLSDSHGSFQSIMNAVESEKDISLIIFAGDIQRDADDIAAAYPDIPFEYVLGNNDWYVNDVPYDRLFEFSGKRIFLYSQRFHYSPFTRYIFMLKKYSSIYLITRCFIHNLLPLNHRLSSFLKSYHFVLYHV